MPSFPSVWSSESSSLNCSPRTGSAWSSRRFDHRVPSCCQSTTAWSAPGASKRPPAVAHRRPRWPATTSPFSVAAVVGGRASSAMDSSPIATGTIHPPRIDPTRRRLPSAPTAWGKYSVGASGSVPSSVSGLFPSGSPPARSHSLAVPSSLVVSSRVPSGLKDTDSTHPRWSRRGVKGSPVPRSQTRAVPSALPAARRNPSGPNAQHRATLFANRSGGRTVSPWPGSQTFSQGFLSPVINRIPVDSSNASA